MATPFDFLMSPGADPYSPFPPVMPQTPIPAGPPINFQGQSNPFTAPAAPPMPQVPDFQTTVTPEPQPEQPLTAGPGNPFVQRQPQAGEDSILGVPWATVERALEKIESGGRWDKLGPMITNPNSRYRGDRAYGRYQFMGRDIPELTRQYYGQSLTPQEFLQNPEAQTAVFRGRFGAHAQQFGSLTDAAQAHFAGPGSFNRPNRGLDLTDAQQGFRGTSVRDYRRLFESGLSSAGPPPEAGPQFNQLEMSPALAEATGQPQAQPYGQFAPQAPAPISQTATAMAPGLARLSATQPSQAAAGAIPFGDLWADMGARPSGLTQLASHQAQQGSAQQIAAANIFARGQELRAENPNATPDQIARLLIRDPAWGQNAISLGLKSGEVLQAAVSPPAPISMQAVSPGQQIFQQQGGVVSPTGQGLPPQQPDPVRIAQWIQSLPPEQQPQAMSILQGLRAGGPSDREQAIARIQASEAAGLPPSQHDLQLAGYLRQEPVVNDYGQVTGYRTVDTYNQQLRARYPGAGVSGAASPPGAPGASGVTPPALGAPGSVMAPPPIPTQAPGTSFSQQPWQPGQPIPPEVFETLQGGVTGLGGPTPAAQSRPATPPGQIDMTPQVVAQQGDRDIVDIPGLSLQTSLVSNAAHMALGAGPISAFQGAWGRIMGNLIPGTGEEVLNRQALLQNFRSAYAKYRGGSRLAGEHREAMADVPEPGQIYQNPLASVNQFIAIREQLVRSHMLVRQQAMDQSLSAATRNDASKAAAEIQGLLMQMASMSDYLKLANDLRNGVEVSGTGLPDVTRMMSEGMSAVGKAGSTLAGGSSQKSIIPSDLSGYNVTELQRLSKRRDLPPADASRLIDAIRSKMGASQ